MGPPMSRPLAVGWLALLPVAFAPATWPLAFNGNSLAGVVSEDFGTHQVSSVNGRLTITGSNRLYLVDDWTTTAEWSRDWTKVSYTHLPIASKLLRFEVDVSGVDCGCNAAVYLVRMTKPGVESSNYCDIQGIDSGVCAEIDLFEGNRKAVQSTLHLRSGHGPEGGCNQDGCYANVGKSPTTHSGLQAAELYGPGGAIDTARPFHVVSTFSADGTLMVDLVQQETTLRLLDGSPAGTPLMAVRVGDDGRGEEDRATTAEAVESGLVLAVSLWQSEHMDWLNGEQCEPRCDLGATSFSLGRLEVGEIPPPPTPPPAAPPAAPPPTPTSGRAAMLPLLLLSLAVAGVLVATRAQRLVDPLKTGMAASYSDDSSGASQGAAFAERVRESGEKLSRRAAKAAKAAKAGLPRGGRRGRGDLVQEQAETSSMLSVEEDSREGPLEDAVENAAHGGRRSTCASWP